MSEVDRPMSETGSVAGSQSSLRSSLKGWAGGQGFRSGGREDIDATRSSTSSYTSSRALQGPLQVRRDEARQIPASSPTLTSAASSGRPSDVGGVKMDDQLKKERIWWSEHALFEVQKLELSVKQELQKTTAALREQFRRQLEIERNDSQLRDSSLERAIARLRDDMESLREQQQQQVGQPQRPDLSEDINATMQQLAATVSQTEANLRLDLDAMTFRLEDYHRQHQEELSVALAAQHSALETERVKMQQSTAELQQELIALGAKLDSREQSRNDANVSIDRFQAQLSAALAQEQSARSHELEGLREEVFKARNFAKDLVEESLSQTKKVQTAATASKANSEMDSRVQDLVGVIKAESAQRKAEVDSLRVELSREHEARKLELNEARGAWRNEAQRLAEDIANAQISTEAATSSTQSADATARLDAQIQELLSVVEAERKARQASIEELDRHIQGKLDHSQRTISGSSVTGETVRELVGFMEEECKARKTDVEDLRHQLSVLEALIMERTTTESLQGSVGDLDMRIGNLVSALETEREARRNDSERHQLNQSDLRDELKAERKLRLAEVEKLRAALAELALNFNSAMAGEATIENSQELSKVFASLRAVLDEETSKSAAYSRAELNESMRSGAGSDLVLELAASGGGEKLKAEAGALRSDLSAALGREATELLARIRSLGTELRNELNSRVEVVSAGLREDIAAARAELHGDITATSGELQAELNRQFENFVGQNMLETRGTTPAAQTGLQSNAAVIGQLSEVLRLMQIITSSSEVLAEKICGEAAARRSAEGRLDARLSTVERGLRSLGAADDSTPPAEPEPLPHQAGGQAAAVLPFAAVAPGAFAAVAPGAEQQQQQQLQHQLQAQTLISEDLKDSLEKLVTRVNRMLKPEDAGAVQREGSFTPSLRSGISRTHSPERQRSGFFQLSADGNFAMSASSSAAATPSNPEAAARHPGSVLLSGVTSTALGGRLGARRGNEGPTPSASTSHTPKVSEQTKLIHKAVQDLYHENNQLRDELSGQGSPQGRGGGKGESAAQPLGVVRGVSSAAGGPGSSVVGSGPASLGGSMQKGSPRANSLQQGAPAQAQGLVRGMPMTRGTVQNPAVLANQARGAPQALRRGVLSSGYGRAGSPSGIAPSR